ncbi:MarR family winged helix-turn-helix transcriptional regulator [Ferrimonas balearica]|uniref:MarR family winged helix-turn-helix transcriptional regulator n=1 Tax=Ferrimonas balearica TaxID=44012 RepID=UPI001C99172F|nr:MarR family winged helix-turn-helix transcriptional regulator [Ferrimonas balearica]MBY5921100.1 MarR family winged helix-turn-helix transcriptional regulator [Ferrimonas balearica]MBY5996215.1 MarR family winged helix-turn-helix transcriptional regulator [Ferrimonas balearica]
MSDSPLLESVFQLFHIVKKAMQQEIEELGLELSPMHVRVLKVIASRTQCTANNVVQGLSRDKAQVTRLLNTLMVQGLLVKKPNPEDKRSQLLALTEVGWEVMEQVEAIDAQITRKMAQGLSSNELAEFQRLAHVITHSLN